MQNSKNLKLSHDLIRIELYKERCRGVKALHQADYIGVELRSLQNYINRISRFPESESLLLKIINYLYDVKRKEV